uniref:ER membrane protein complex subunit 6 n=1 Tax=Lactuca sativa TaxID=4236 RepID=A0A9R1XK94_LACSA|nr:hypothetical protein LSAT_V11C300156160 [Lactuca sativa]
MDSSVSGKKSSENEIPTFNIENMQSNMKVIYYSRTFMSIIGGVIAGILGVNGLMGFVIYCLVMAITSVCLTAKAGFSIHSYFDTWNRILLDGFLGGLLPSISLSAVIRAVLDVSLYIRSFFFNFLHICWVNCRK